MAIVPDPSAEPQPAIDMQTETPDSGALSEDQLRAAATRLDLDYDRMNEDEREFVGIYARGELDTVPPVVPGDVTDEATPPIDAAPEAPTDDTEALATPGAESDDAGVGSASDGAGSDGGVAPAVAVPEPPAGVSSTPAAPLGYEIPSPLPPFTPPAPEVPQQQEQLVMLPDGTMAPLSVAIQIAERQAALEQQAQQQRQPAPLANPWEGQPNVPAGAPPFGGPGDYLDERAGQEISRLDQQLAEIRASQAASQRTAQMQHEQAVMQAIHETTEQYRTARNLSAEQAEALLGTATQLGSLAQYGQLYPGDPRRAVGAALEAAYWLTPEYRQAEIDRAVQAQVEAVTETERKKALAGSTTSPTGSVPRAPAPAANREQRDAGMVAMIEAEIARTNGGATSR